MKQDKKSIIVSACLLGELCRYDGSAKNTLALSSALKDYKIIPFCPEAPLFGTPRERISVVQGEDGNKIVVDTTKEDVTLKLRVYIEDFLKQHSAVKLALLKAKSPSCGYKSTPILNEAFNQVSLGSGIAAQMFSAAGVEIVDELNYERTLKTI